MDNKIYKLLAIIFGLGILIGAAVFTYFFIKQQLDAKQQEIVMADQQAAEISKKFTDFQDLSHQALTEKQGELDTAKEQLGQNVNELNTVRDQLDTAKKELIKKTEELSEHQGEPRQLRLLFSNTNKSEALNFNGSDQYVNLGRSSELRPAGAFSVSAWVYLAGDQTERIIVADWDEVNDELGRDLRNGYGLGIADNIGNKVKFVIGYNGAGTYYDLDSNTTLNNNTWYLLTATYDGSKGSLYINGVLDNSTSNTYNPTYLNTNEFVIGSLHHNGVLSQYFNGQVDDVRVYDRALNTNEIAALYDEASKEGM